MIRNKLWIIKSRGFKIKNKILPLDLVTFQILTLDVSIQSLF